MSDSSYHMMITQTKMKFNTTTEVSCIVLHDVIHIILQMCNNVLYYICKKHCYVINGFAW